MPRAIRHIERSLIGRKAALCFSVVNVSPGGKACVRPSISGISPKQARRCLLTARIRACSAEPIALAAVVPRLSRPVESLGLQGVGRCPAAIQPFLLRPHPRPGVGTTHSSSPPPGVPQATPFPLRGSTPLLHLREQLE